MFNNISSFPSKDTISATDAASGKFFQKIEYFIVLSVGLICDKTYALFTAQWKLTEPLCITKGQVMIMSLN